MHASQAVTANRERDLKRTRRVQCGDCSQVSTLRSTKGNALFLKRAQHLGYIVSRVAGNVMSCEEIKPCSVTGQRSVVKVILVGGHVRLNRRFRSSLIG